MASPGNDSELLLLILLLQSLSEEDDPFFGREIYERLRRRLKQSELFDPEIDDLLERRFRYPGRYRDRRLSEAREVATSVLEGFRRSFEESTSKKLDELEQSIKGLSGDNRSIVTSLESQKEEFIAYRRTSQDYLWLLSTGADIARAELIRYLPVRVYISEPVPEQKTLNNIVESIEQLLDGVGFEKSDEFPEESGSWWKRLVLKTKNFFTQKEVTDNLKKAARATEIAILDRPQAEANLCQAQAASALISSLSGTESACIQAGSLLIVKASNNGNSSIIARTLTPMELKRLEENQAVLRKPEEIMDWLQSTGNKRLTNKPSRPPSSAAD